MVKGYIFDYGGTIDTAGVHWGRVIWRAFRKHGVAVSEDEFREAYVHGERTLGTNRIIRPDYTFYNTLDTKLNIELDYLAGSGCLDISESDLLSTRRTLLKSIYNDVKKDVAHSKKVLDILSAEYPLVLVSNFYGNINTVLEEFGLGNLFAAVIESAAVGIRKPDPGIFVLGVKALNLKPEEVMVVGDSFTKDIIPAARAGCKTTWIKGEGWTEEKFDETAADRTITRLDQLL